MDMIVDCGSTKCRWTVIGPGIRRAFDSPGFNPALLDTPEIESTFADRVPQGLESMMFEQVWIYAAGCRSEREEKSTVESTASASLPSTAEPKQQRVGIRQRRLDFEEYKATYLSSKTLTDRKQTNISRELYDRIALMVRRLGDIDTTVSGFIDSVLRQHMEDYASDHEVWRKL